MNDRAVSLFDNYEIEIVRTWKGRGAILCESDKGLLILKEYNGPANKILFQDTLLKHIKDAGFPLAETILRTREDEMIVYDQDRVPYIVKSYFEGKECNNREPEECKQAVQILAQLHNCSDLSAWEGLSSQPVFHIEKEYEKHNRELKKVRRFLREKSQKTAFEIYLMEHYDYFLDTALQVTGEIHDYLYDENMENSEKFPIVCHGDYQYHNIIQTVGGIALINFEKCVRDNPMRDLYLFMRKLLEKNNWSQTLGDALLSAYDAKRTLTDKDFEHLYYRFAYPEKFWKIANFYYNSGKAWIPGRNMDKLERLLTQENAKKDFLSAILARKTD
ncbi:MAG: CotS family spore coat protein [Lachnospiraceae bacterium]|nr:CotS family spore coat protein [Lachnospiraceae bacterium]